MVNTIRIQNIIKPFLLISFSILCIYSVFNHEPWRDEAQAWLIARDCNLSELFNQITYEGHPALWFLILFPFAKFAPFWMIYVINSAVYILFLYLIIYKCPLKLWCRAAILFIPPAIVYSYQARSYMLFFALLMLCAYIYPKRAERPLMYAISIVLLANTHAYAIGAAGALFLCYAYDYKTYKHDKRFILSIIIMLSGFAVFLLQVIPSLGKNQYVPSVIREGTSPFDSAVSIFKKMSDVVFVTYESFPAKIGIFLILALVVLSIILCLKGLKSAVIIVGSIVFPIIFFIFIYGMHYEILFLLMFFTAWMIKNEHHDKSKFFKIIHSSFLILISILSLISIPHTKLFLEINNSKEMLTSGSIDAAKFLNRDENKNSIIVAEYPPYASAVVPMLNDKRKLWYSYTEDFGSFVTWSKELANSQELLDEQNLESIIRKNFNKNDNILVLLSSGFPLESNENFVLVYETPNCPNDECFRIYSFKW